ncbi:MAG: hypothetical protein Q4P05_06980 [Actinomycetaceae bacterium]|nr:hypothetical protein [Actinomycetaceae bacterium]
MARISHNDVRTVVTLSDSEWAYVKARFAGVGEQSEAPQSLFASGVLASTGLLDDTAKTAFGGLIDTQQVLETRRLRADGTFRVEAWITPSSVTLARHVDDGIHVYAIDPEELPSVMLEVLDLRPRPALDAGPYELPLAMDEAVRANDVDAMQQVFNYWLSVLIPADETEEDPDPTPLMAGVYLKRWTWVSTTLATLNDGEWSQSTPFVTLSVPHCLYRVFPVAKDNGNSVEQAWNEINDETENLELKTINSMNAWALLSQWMFTAEPSVV